jgi:hypothetical protein
MKRRSTIKLTFNEIFHKVEEANMGRLIRRAELADSLAKILTGNAKAKAYRVSHEALDSFNRRAAESDTLIRCLDDGRREPPARAAAQRWACH